MQPNRVFYRLYDKTHSLKPYPWARGAIAEVFGVAELYYAVDIEFFAR